MGFSLMAWVYPRMAKAKIKLFLEYGHDAYQSKGNDACINMVANSLLTDNLDPRYGVKGQNIFS